ncbi:MAG TPA: TIGR02680 family protein [Chthoniobacterales bacterium]
MSDELFGEPSGDGAFPPRILPRPTRERWQPLRSGLLNIFKYDEEEFLFEDGRLLLRGNNGAGKSRVLALQLPFLLDGEMAPHRVEPDADPAKRMEWNLLMNKHENRLGYTWIEFGRRDADGVERYLTLGCGMHARKGTGIPPNGRWFFITPRRVGATLQLLSGNRVPLNRERLEAVLGPGAIYRSAREYRAAVDAALFGLGARYEPLLELLIQLRKPQIMRDFKADDLSRLLSEAMPPLSTRLVENVSVSFRSLDTDRQQLTELTDTRRSVETFLKSYQHYVQVAVRRRAAEVRATHSRFESVQRELKRLRDQRDQIAADLVAAETDQRQIEEALAATREAERTLLASPEMKNAEALRHAAEAKEDRVKRATAAEESAREARNAHGRMRHEREEAEGVVMRERQAADVLHAALTDAWRSAALADNALPLREPAEKNARTDFDRTVAERRRVILILRENNSVVARNVDLRKQEEIRFEQRRDDVARCEEALANARTECGQALEDALTGIHQWEAALQLLPMTKGVDWRVLLERWLDATGRPSPLTEYVEAAHRSAAQTVFDARSRQKTALAEQATARREAADELDGLRAGRQPEPPTPHTRMADARAGRPGAPFWKLCGFRDHVAPEDRAGFEAAAEAAGLLDAWLTPDGALINAGTLDCYFVAADGRRDAGLNAVLYAEGEMTDVVERVLGCIGTHENEGKSWLSRDGRWQHGLLRGAWRKPKAEYLGHGAREDARRQRMQELESVLAAIDRVVAQHQRELEDIAQRAKGLEAERAGVPSLAPLQRAAHTLEAAEHSSAEARARLDEVDRLLATAREGERGACQRRDRDAADLGLAAWKEPEAVSRLETLLIEVRLKAAALWPAWDALLAANAALLKAGIREREAQHAAEAVAGRYEEARQLAAAATAHFATLHAAIGATADQVLSRLGSVRRELTHLVEAEKTGHHHIGKLNVTRAVAVNDGERAESDRVVRELERGHAIARLQLFAEKRLLEETGVNLGPDPGLLAPSAAVDLARQIEQVFGSVAADEDAWKRVQAGIQQQFTQLNDHLGAHGYYPQAEVVDEGVFAITCAFHGQTCTMTALRQSISDEIQSREQMLNAREREVIENHLIGEVATELQNLIRAGEDWVRTVNEELAQRPTSSGIKLRFSWDVDAEASAGLDAARRQLLKMTAAWSPAERDSIGRFLQDRINGERAADESAPWQDHLHRALDYRAWHRFGIMRFQDGQWKKLTKQTYGTGSGGEKALTLMLPQFAAAAAHYRSASPHAPRLILLDEVFIGIDAPTRARLMGLLTSFELDFVMTSEREWGCYSTLPALSICQLASHPDSPAVHVTRWVWNGRQLSTHPNGSSV